MRDALDKQSFLCLDADDDGALTRPLKSNSLSKGLRGALPGNPKNQNSSPELEISACILS